MKKLLSLLVSLLASLIAAAASAQSLRYPPLGAYMMDQQAEVALAKSAAPENVSGRASIKILTDTGYKVVAQGDNGFVCVVLRGWAAPTFSPIPLRDLVYDAKLRAPICFDPVAARTVQPYQELRAKLAMEGKGPTRLPPALLRPMSKVSCREWRPWRSRTCIRRTCISGRKPAIFIRT
jgi:hypothetical protein